MASKKSSHKSDKKGGGGLLFSVALGAALAAAAGYYATHKDEVDREAKKQLDQLAKKFKETRPIVEKRVREVWGEVSEEAIATYLDARGALLHALEEENLEKTGKMLRKEYDHLVEMAVKQARKSGLLNKEIEKRLEHLFKMDWKEIQKILGTGAQNVAKTAKKEAKKAAKTMTGGGKKKTTRKSPAKKKTASKRKTTAKRSTSKKKSARKAPAKKTTRKSTKRKK